MAKTETLNLEVKSNIKSVTKDTDKMADSLDDVNKEAKDSIGNFTLMGVSLNGVKAAFGKVIPMAKAMFGSIKAGLISTGIGAFVVLIGSLISYFTQTKRGAEFLKQAMAGLGAVVSVVTDLFSSVGEEAVSAFKDPKKAITELWEFIKDNLMNRLTGMVDGFTAAGKTIQAALRFDWDEVKEGALDYGTALIQVATGMDAEQQKKFLEGVKDIGKELSAEAIAMVALEKASQKLADSQRDLNVETAQAVADIEKLKLKAEDITKTYKEREEAANSAFKKETDLENKRIELAKEAVRIQKAQMEMSENTAEDLDALAELEINLANVRQESAGRQISLQNFLNGLRETEKAQKEADKAKADADKLAAEATAKSEADFLLALQQENTLALIADLEERALAELKIQEDKELASAELMENSELVKEEIREKFARKRGEIGKKDAEEQVKWSEMSSEQQLGIASSTAGDMATILGEETAAGKAFAITQATIDTFASAQSSFKSMSGIPVIGPALGGIAAAAAVAAGLANVKAIAGAGGGGGGGGGGSAPSVPALPQIPAHQMMSGAFELSGGQEPEPLQAYVVSDDITDSQNSLEIIRRRATI